MDDLLRFLGVMSALSASAQTMTQQLRKRLKWFEAKPCDQELDGQLVSFTEGKLHANVHLICGINGFILAALGNIHPLSYLGLTPIWAMAASPWISHTMDYICAGVLVAYGGPWFHEILGILREYKLALKNR